MRGPFVSSSPKYDIHTRAPGERQHQQTLGSQTALHTIYKMISTTLLRCQTSTSRSTTVTFRSG